MTTRQIIPSFFTASKLGFLRKTRTPVGKILKMGEYEIDLNDGGLFLNIVIDNSYTTSEQTDESFTITVYGIRLSKRFQAI